MQVERKHIGLNKPTNSIGTNLLTKKTETRSACRVQLLANKIEKIKKTRTLKANIEKVLEFDKECEQNGYKMASRYSALLTLHCLCQFANRKPFVKFEKRDILHFLDSCKYRKFEDTRRRAKVTPQKVETQLANSSMNLVKLRVKCFFQWLNKMDKGEYPECVQWIVVKQIKGDRVLRDEELPTPDEAVKMIECTENPRDRALISLMVESGARIGEISTTRLEDVSWNKHGFVLTLQGKTGQRQIPLCASMIDLKNWINDFHPFKNNPEAPLFTSYANKRNPPANLKINGIRKIVQRVANRSGVGKRIRVYPHLFRHLRATQLAETGWNEAMLRKYFGWSKNSNMPSIYIHLSKKALNDKYYQMYGKVVQIEKSPIALSGLQKCAICRTQNPHGYRFCYSCNAPLEEKDQKLLENKRYAVQTLNRISMDPQLREDFLSLIRKAQSRSMN